MLQLSCHEAPFVRPDGSLVSYICDPRVGPKMLKLVPRLRNGIVAHANDAIAVIGHRPGPLTGFASCLSSSSAPTRRTMCPRHMLRGGYIYLDQYSRARFT